MSYPTVEQELVAACRVCVSSITQFVEVDTLTSTDWANLLAARHLARRALGRYDVPASRAGEKQEPNNGAD